jgi:hypothetical protein
MKFARFAAPAAVPLAVLIVVFKPRSTRAHGFAGQRLVPATILTDDPFVVVEGDFR